MLTIRKSAARGSTRLNWLDSRHTFSFGDYVDARYHRFRSLRVLNDDRIAPAGGFGMHPHRDMEILTYVLAGELEHADSMGHSERLRAGEWQMMTAGTGLLHSEFNPSRETPVHLLQIWLMPDRRGLTPGYAQKAFPLEGRQGRWQLTASPDGANDSLTIHQDARLSVAKLAPQQSLAYDLAPGRGAFLHVATGSATVNGERLDAGDAIAIEDEPKIEVLGQSDGEVLLFDLA